MMREMIFIFGDLRLSSSSIYNTVILFFYRFMPDGMYLDALSLGPEELAKRMNEIINDRNTYYDFFKWHGHYSFHNSDEDVYRREVCALCELLNNETVMEQSTVFNDLNLWWNEEHPASQHDYRNPRINTYKRKSKKLKLQNNHAYLPMI